MKRETLAQAIARISSREGRQMSDRPEWIDDRAWMREVHAMIGEGLACEDIAARTGAPLSAVMAEASNLRRLGALDDIYRGRA